MRNRRAQHLMFVRVTSDVGFGIFGGSVISRLGNLNDQTWRLGLTRPDDFELTIADAYVIRKFPIDFERLG
jgi:hypothetical protein